MTPKGTEVTGVELEGNGVRMGEEGSERKKIKQKGQGGERRGAKANRGKWRGEKWGEGGAEGGRERRGVGERGMVGGRSHSRGGGAQEVKAVVRSRWGRGGKRTEEYGNRGGGNRGGEGRNEKPIGEENWSERGRHVKVG